ncbi:glycoside hydrolase family 3 C-terminal domain-containing protein [Microbacterium sp. A84]|uniref:glycoside hydrolase family 3 C-terminal domain-containing protein n=1 Tax=Microbacterium sp. A84 TaxID=3450715 RepID=UPI003F41F2E8
MTSSATSALSVEETLAAMTLHEKVGILEGVEFWNTAAIERLGVPALYLTDGPHGVRKVRTAAGAFGVGDNEPSTAFPTSATVANSWSPENARLIGVAIGRESADSGVDVLLAPGVNIKRNPLCGRNFEYFSEDPLVSGMLGAAFVQGIQSEGIAASVKHFAANSNENFRFVGDSQVDERALREIYLRQFERVVTHAKPHTVMCAYNAIGGVFSSDNRELLTRILRDEWGFDGVVMTDWGATHDRIESIQAGCELDMPGGTGHNGEQLIAAIGDGRLDLAVLDEAVRRMLTLVERMTVAPRRLGHDPVEHRELARQVATEGAVLLANDGILPLDQRADSLLIVGEMFKQMRFQGAGSSLINPTEVVSPQIAFDHRGIDYIYATGYRSTYPKRDRAMENEALAAAKSASTVLFFGGLTDLEESEGFDRESMALGENQTALLRQLLDSGARVVLVLFAGAPVELPFADELAAVLDMYLPGMAGGEAAAALLFGEANPSGRLAESWPLTAGDASSAADFDHGTVAQYYESIYVGYRFYDKAKTVLRYAFGHGLSYTQFDYGDLAVSVQDGRVGVSVHVSNTGSRDGAEVVQLYVRNNAGEVFKAEKELRAFTRVEVPAGDTVEAALSFELSDLAYWDVRDRGWILENGDYEILIAASSDDIRSTAPLRISSGRDSRSPYLPEVERAYAMPPVQIPESFSLLLGREVPIHSRSHRLTMETRLADARHSVMGAIMYQTVVSRMKKDYLTALALPDGLERDARVKNAHFVLRMMPFNSLRSMAMSASGQFPFNLAQGIADIAAFHPIRGLRRILGKKARS